MSEQTSPIVGEPRRIERFQRVGLTFDVRDEGPIDGAVIVLLHGFPERASCWDAVVPQLHEAGYRTLAPDQRGYSRGARPQRRRDYASRELALDVIALIEEAATDGARVHLVGHDWGAIVAWAVAAVRPDLLASLTAFSVPHPQAYLRALAGPQLPKSWYMAMFQVPFLPERLAARRDGIFDRFLRIGGMSEGEVSRFRSEMVEDGALAGGLGWYRAMPFMDRSQLGVRIQVPTAMVWSDGDGFLARAGVLGTEKHVEADYQLEIIEGVDHWIPTHAPERAAAAILRRVDGVATAS
ncbi:alpha/beta fold hydrolase [Nocardioides sp. R-C-SC26]|uniref:alpha/beta fold hydrolase n=1 Tax=Nocardioides sp. R-C-SC26 TaxID=2870414 RepID=UPI001E48DA00|nr:alpha/beta fold hydrolase [Nocardioides sp. R-C-SC26]